MPPTVHPRLELVYQEVARKATKRGKSSGKWTNLESWPIVQHLDHTRTMDGYGYTKEIWFHQEIDGTSDEFMGLVRSYRWIDRALKAGATEAEIGLNALKSLSDEIIGPEGCAWIFGYRLLVAVRDL